MNLTASRPGLSIKTVRGQTTDPLRNEILTQARTEHPLSLPIRGIGKEHIESFPNVLHPDLRSECGIPNENVELIYAD